MYTCLLLLIDVRFSLFCIWDIMTLDKDLGSQEIDNDQNDRDDCLFDPKTV